MLEAYAKTISSLEVNESFNSPEILIKAAVFKRRMNEWISMEIVQKYVCIYVFKDVHIT